MRERGIRRAKLGDLELELGELPSTPFEPREETETERQNRERLELRRELDVRYAQVGGFPGTNEELDRMLEGRS